MPLVELDEGRVVPAGTADPSRSPSSRAPSPVVAAVTDRVDAATLVWILGRAGLASRLTWVEVARGFPGGVAAFAPSGPDSGSPRLVGGTGDRASSFGA